MMSVPGLVGFSSFEQKAKAVHRAAVRLSASCSRCGTRCPVRAVDIDTSGSPCQDWSSAGLRQGTEGKRIHLLLLWISWHRVMGTAIIIHENVKGFDMSLLQKFLGDLYEMRHVEVGPEHVGWPCCKRPRLYIAMLHRNKVRMQCDPIWLFWQVSARLQSSLRVRDLLIATNAEVRYECEQRRRRSASAVRCKSAGSRDRRFNWALPVRRECLASAAQQHGLKKNALTTHEQARLHFYAVVWAQRYRTEAQSERDLLFNLGDNPDGGWLTWSAPSCGGPHRVPTFRKHWTAQWSPHCCRWLTSTERLVCMGFPATPNLAACYGMSETYLLTWKQRHTLGNAMHLANIGVFQACVAASVCLM